ncbi:MAG TPA: CoA pyrophosphatase [Bacteroidota bacterium]|nr:CoA pyrophosphatase [Bacteroidota bacterium]
MLNITGDLIRSCFSSQTQRVELSLPGYTRAAVLIPIVERNGALDLLFTRRTETVETHKGQVSFPGGMVNADDADVVHTALREAQEEVGIPSSAVEIVGLLDDIATPTRFVITPVVGIIHQLPPLVPNPTEVAEVFLVPLAFFAREDAGRSEMRDVGGRRYNVWFYEYQHHVIWGATAVIIRSLLKKLAALPQDA